MSFLAPLFMLGALAVVAPILFHLIRRTTRDKIPISSLMFLRPSPPRVTKRSRIENWLLLVLRCLVICLLALGFARPFLQNPLIANQQESNGMRILYLVDTSASMRREGLWDELVRRLESDLKKTEAGDQAAILTFGDTEQTVFGFEEWNSLPPAERIPIAMSRIHALNPGWSATRLGQALLHGVELFEDEEKNDVISKRKRIVVLSDLQEGSRLAGLQGYEWPRDLEVDARPLVAQKKTNAGIQILLERESANANPTNEGSLVTVRVTNAADSSREQFQLLWTSPSNDAPIGGITDVYVPPGQSRILSIAMPDSLTQAAQLKLTGDEESFDNRAFFVPPQLNAVPILFLTTSDGDDPQSMLYYLKRALQHTTGYRVDVLPHANQENLTTNKLESIRLAMGSGALTQISLGTITSFVRQGKTLLWILDSTASLNALAAMTDGEGLTATEAKVNDYAMLGKIDFSHPLFAPFADPRYSDFTKIHFWKYRKFNTNALPQAKLLAQFDDGSPALMEFPLGRGRVLVLASSWRPADSQLALSSKFVPLIYSLLDYSGALPSDDASYFVGQSFVLDSGGDATAWTVVKPDGTEVEVAETAIFDDTDQPGVYTAKRDDLSRQFAVNLIPEESRTAPLSMDSLESLGVPVQFSALPTAALDNQETKHLKATELESHQKLWRWLFVGALILLLIEIWLGGRLSRRPVAEPA